MASNLYESLGCFKCEKRREEVALLRESLQMMKQRVEVFERYLHRVTPTKGSGVLSSKSLSTLMSASTLPLKNSDGTPSSSKKIFHASSPLNKLWGNSEDECSVCLLPLEKSGRALFRTSCGHVFHFQCAKECVLTNQNGCPMCRKSFSEMTPPRTPLTQRDANTIYPGFVTASSLLQTTSASNITTESTVVSAAANVVEETIESMENLYVADENDENMDPVLVPLPQQTSSPITTGQRRRLEFN